MLLQKSFIWTADTRTIIYVSLCTFVLAWFSLKMHTFFPLSCATFISYGLNNNLVRWIENWEKIRLFFSDNTNLRTAKLISTYVAYLHTYVVHNHSCYDSASSEKNVENYLTLIVPFDQSRYMRRIRHT